MKKIYLFFLMVSLACFLNNASAQLYKNAAGLSIDFGDGFTLVGPSIKHYFNQHSAVQGELLFGNGATFISAFYHYNGGIPNAKGLLDNEPTL